MFRDDLRDLAKSSNGSKIARIAPISKILGSNESSRCDLFLETSWKERNKRKDFKQFENFSNFAKSLRSFRSFEKFSKNRLRRDDSFGPKIVEIGAILAIFRPFEFFQKNTHFPGL